jgi:hypothetical protein
MRAHQCSGIDYVPPFCCLCSNARRLALATVLRWVDCNVTHDVTLFCVAYPIYTKYKTLARQKKKSCNSYWFCSYMHGVQSMLIYPFLSPSPPRHKSTGSLHWVLLPSQSNHLVTCSFSYRLACQVRRYYHERWRVALNADVCRAHFIPFAEH